MQQTLDAPGLLEKSQSGKDATDDEEPPKILPPLLRLRSELGCWLRQTQATIGFGQSDQGLIVQGHRPGAAELLSHACINRLQGVIPISLTVGGEMSFWN